MPKLLFCLFLALPWSLRADLGNSVVYHATVYLKSGAVLTGYFPVYEYADFCYLDEQGRNAYCNDAGLMQVFRAMASQTRLMGYEKIYYPRYYCLPDQQGKADFNRQLSAGLASDTFSIQATELLRVHFLGVEANRSFLPGVEALRIMSPEMLALVRSGPYFGGYHYYVENGPAIVLLNYNPQYNQAEIDRLYRTYWQRKLSVYDASEKKYQRWQGEKLIYYDEARALRDYRAHQQALQDLRAWFEARQVVVIFDHGTC